MTYYLVVLDVTRIQNYLFGSNRLSENIGASELVAQVTEQWIFDTANELGLQHNFNFSDQFNYQTDDWFDETKSLAAENVKLEVIFTGGGNAVLMFSEAEGEDKAQNAKRFVQELTEKVIIKTPGLKIAVALTSFDMNVQVLKEVYNDLWQKLAKKKAQQQPFMPLLGMSVTADCNSTGLPAVAVDKSSPNRLVSPEITAKLNFNEAADLRLKNTFLPDNYPFEFEKDFNLLGKKDKGSYVAVVHADGNRIGHWLKGLTETLNSVEDNLHFIKVHREASQNLRRIAISAMQAVVEAVIKGLKSPAVMSTKEYHALPLRPLVVSGDDTTFVCEGKLGLSLAVIYLKAFRAKALALNIDLHACAGVAIVHTHYPFARSYHLSEALVKRAKKYVREVRENDESLSALDWHFAINGLIDELETIRQQDYTVIVDENNVSLSLRPLQLTETDEEELHSWENFKTVILDFQADDWQAKRNKLKTLREVLRDGPDATQYFLETYQLTGKLSKLSTDTRHFQQTGWSRSRLECGYFDAIEAVDHFIDLEEKT